MSDLQRAARKVAEWTARRDALIRQDQRSLRDIAADVGLSHTAVADIKRNPQREKLWFGRVPPMDSPEPERA